MNIMGGSVRKALLMSAVALSTSACASGHGGVHDLGRIQPMHGSTAQAGVAHDLNEGRPAVRRVRLSGDFFVLRPMGGEMPREIADARVRLDFGGQTPTFDDLLLLLEDRGLSVIMGWDDGSYGEGTNPQVQATRVEAESEARSQSDGNPEEGDGPQTGRNAERRVTETTTVRNNGRGYESIRTRPLPFRRYEGTLGGLFRQIQRSMGVTIWWNNGIYVSPVGRYSVMLPQNRELMQQVTNELQAKGARNVVASLQAGTVSFVAPGALAEEVIRPYLLRLGRNASEITMQVALVSVVMNEQTSRGFDWSQFNFAFGDPGSQSGVITPQTPGMGNGPVPIPGTGTGTGSNLPPGGLFSFANDSLRVFHPSATIFGATRPLDITGAIKFLSTYGHTSVDQNVELRTLAGTEVNWRSGETIPYVSGVSATAGGLGGLGGTGGIGQNLLGSAQTEKLETGLTLTLAPNYEAAGGLVTVAFKLELTELIEFVNLNAGNQLGSFTQPRTREQKLDDIVRIPVGETVVLGGLRRQMASTNRNGPFSLYSIGSRDRDNETQTIFILMRPSVTLYEVAGLDVPLPNRSNEVLLGSDGQPWAPIQQEYRGTNMFGGADQTAQPVRRRSMAQPERAYDDE